MKRDLTLAPAVGDGEAIGGVSEEPVELHGDDGVDATRLNLRQQRPAGRPLFERLASSFASSFAGDAARPSLENAPCSTYPRLL